jgi:hypothetical protein
LFLVLFFVLGMIFLSRLNLPKREAVATRT